MNELASHVVSFDKALLTSTTAPCLWDGSVRFVTTRSSNGMNLKRCCPPPVQYNPNLLHRAHAGFAMSHYGLISV
jgi:hypothetical protein